MRLNGEVRLGVRWCGGRVAHWGGMKGGGWDRLDSRGRSGFYRESVHLDEGRLCGRVRSGCEEGSDGLKSPGEVDDKAGLALAL